MRWEWTVEFEELLTLELPDQANINHVNQSDNTIKRRLIQLALEDMPSGLRKKNYPAPTVKLAEDGYTVSFQYTSEE